MRPGDDRHGNSIGEYKAKVHGSAGMSLNPGSFRTGYSLSVSDSDKETKPASVTVREFMEKTPPGTWTNVVGIPHPRSSFGPGSIYQRHLDPKIPDIELHCEECRGLRMFSTKSEFDVALPGIAR